MEARRRQPARAHAGYMLAGLVAAVAILVILSGIALEAWADVLRRDNEAEMMFRAQDLVRAIQRYRRDHGGTPPLKLEELIKPGPRNQYYLRQLWKDPLVKDGKWGLLYTGPSGELIDPNAAPPAEGQAGPSPSGFRSPFGSPAPQGGTQGNLGQPAVPGAPGSFGTQAGAGQGAAAPFGGATGAGDDPNAGGKQLGGLPIAGVRTLSDDTPFRVYNGFSNYSQWLFSYFDLERAQLPGQGSAGAPAQGMQPTGMPPRAPDFGDRGGFGKRPGFGKSPRGGGRPSVPD